MYLNNTTDFVLKDKFIQKQEFSYSHYVSVIFRQDYKKLLAQKQNALWKKKKIGHDYGDITAQ